MSLSVGGLHRSGWRLLVLIAGALSTADNFYFAGCSGVACASAFRVFLQRSYRLGVDPRAVRRARNGRTSRKKMTKSFLSVESSSGFDFLLQKKSYELHAIDYSGELFIGAGGNSAEGGGKKKNRMGVRTLFDTGSGEFFLPGPDCATCGEHPRLPAPLSSNKPLAIDVKKGLISGDATMFAVNVSNYLVGQESDRDHQDQSGQNYTVRMNFASGSVFGQFHSGELCFSDVGFSDQASLTSPSCVPDFHFLSVSRQRDVFPESASRWGAVLGLSLPDISFGDKESFLLRWWKTAKSRFPETQPLFSMYLAPKLRDPAVLDFGNLPPLIAATAGAAVESPSSSSPSPRPFPNLLADAVEKQQIEHLESASLEELVKLTKSKSSAARKARGERQAVSGGGNVNANARPLSNSDPRIIYVPISNPGYWQLKIEDITIDGKPLNLGCDCERCCQAVVDSGSSVILGPKQVTAIVHEKLGFGGAADADKECTDIDAFPSLGFVIRDERGVPYEFVLNEEDYMDRASEMIEDEPKNEKEHRTRTAPDPVSKDYCWLHFMAGPEDTGRGPLLILGMPFIRRFATVFQFLPGPGKLGFVDSKYVDVQRMTGVESASREGGAAASTSVAADVASSQATAAEGLVAGVKNTSTNKSSSSPGLLRLKGCRENCK